MRGRRDRRVEDDESQVVEARMQDWAGGLRASSELIDEPVGLNERVTRRCPCKR